MAMGLNAYQAGRFKEAASAWETALKLEPDNVPVLRNLGAVYHLLGRDDDAIAALQHALEIKPAADVYTNLGTILFYQGKYDQSVPAFEKAVELGANNFDNWGNLGDAYRWSSGKKDKAKPAYQHAIQLVKEEIAKNPNQIELRSGLGNVSGQVRRQRRCSQALKPVEEAHDTNPSDLYNSALVYELCGKRDQALDFASGCRQSWAGSERHQERTGIRFASRRSPLSSANPERRRQPNPPHRLARVIFLDFSLIGIRLDPQLEDPEIKLLQIKEMTMNYLLNLGFSLAATECWKLSAGQF